MGDRDCNKCVWHTDGNCKKWDCEYKTVEDIRADAFDELIQAINDNAYVIEEDHMYGNTARIVIWQDDLQKIAEQLKDSK